MSAAKTLLALLEHKTGDASAEQLEALLEASHLLVVLRGEGWSDDDVRTRLKAGDNPGKLLLGLFDQGRTADELMARLPADALAKQEAANEARSRQRAAKRVAAGNASRGQTPSAAGSDSDSSGPGLSTAGLVIISLGAVPVILALKIPAALLLLYALDAAVVFGIAALVGAIGGWVLGDGHSLRPLWAAIGLFSTPLGMATAALYARYLIDETSRASVFSVELALAYAVGLLPAVIGWFILALIGRGMSRSNDTSRSGRRSRS